MGIRKDNVAGWWASWYSKSEVLMVIAVYTRVAAAAMIMVIVTWPQVSRPAFLVRPCI